MGRDVCDELEEEPLPYVDEEEPLLLSEMELPAVAPGGMSMFIDCRNPEALPYPMEATKFDASDGRIWIFHQLRRLKRRPEQGSVEKEDDLRS